MRLQSAGSHIARLGTYGLLLAGLVALLSAGCRRGAPVIDPSGRDPDAAGTISGNVRTEEGGAAVADRMVEVVNIDTGERQRTTTSSTGGFTFKVRPGKYRLSVALRDGESILEQPGVMEINPSDVDADADFVIGVIRVTRPRPAPAPNPALGAPVA